MVVRDGRLRPPCSFGRNIQPVSADLARLHHFFQYLVAIGWSLDSNQDSAKLFTESSQVSRGQMASLHNFSFCCLETRVASTFSRREVSFLSSPSRAWISVPWMHTGAPRKWKVLSPMYGITSPLRVSLGSYGLPLEARTARDTHLGMLAFMPDHSSQASVVVRSV